MPSGADTKMYLSPNAHVALGEDRFWLVCETTVLEWSDEAWVLEAMRALERGATVGELKRIAGEQTDALMQDLLRHRLVVLDWRGAARPEHAQVASWLTSVTPDPGGALGRMARAHVVIVGAGGLGGEVAQHLVANGLGQLTLIDPDVVDATNLNRQFLFDHTDIGQPKADVAAKALRARSSLAQVSCHQVRILSSSDLLSILPEDTSLVINCADQPPELWEFLAVACQERGVALMTGGTGIDVGYWGPLITSNHVAWVHAHEAARRRSGGPWIEAYGVSRLCQSSFSPRNSMIAACLAADAFTFCAGTGQPRSLEQRQYLNFQTMLCQPRTLSAEDFAPSASPASKATAPTCDPDMSCKAPALLQSRDQV